MKYFTKEELEDISKELIENPTRETLEKLNKKYNSVVTEEVVVNTEPLISEENSMPVQLPNVNTVTTPVVPILNEVETNKQEPIMQVQNVVPEIVPTVEPLNYSIPSTVVSNLEITEPQSVVQATDIETSNQNIQNNMPVNFNGNLWETPKLEIPNLMQTTDNFKTTQNIMPSTEVPVSKMPFFVTSPESLNNQIPITGTVTNAQNVQPTMFGQFEQSFM